MAAAVISCWFRLIKGVSAEGQISKFQPMCRSYGSHLPKEAASLADVKTSASRQIYSVPRGWKTVVEFVVSTELDVVGWGCSKTVGKQYLHTLVNPAYSMQIGDTRSEV